MPIGATTWRPERDERYFTNQLHIKERDAGKRYQRQLDRMESRNRLQDRQYGTAMRREISSLASGGRGYGPYYGRTPGAYPVIGHGEGGGFRGYGKYGGHGFRGMGYSGTGYAGYTHPPLHRRRRPAITYPIEMPRRRRPAITYPLELPHRHRPGITYPVVPPGRLHSRPVRSSSYISARGPIAAQHPGLVRASSSFGRPSAYRANSHRPLAIMPSARPPLHIRSSSAGGMQPGLMRRRSLPPPVGLRPRAWRNEDRAEDTYQLQSDAAQLALAREEVVGARQARRLAEADDWAERDALAAERDAEREDLIALRSAEHSARHHGAGVRRPMAIAARAYSPARSMYSARGLSPGRDISPARSIMSVPGRTSRAPLMLSDRPFEGHSAMDDLAGELRDMRLREAERIPYSRV